MAGYIKVLYNWIKTNPEYSYIARLSSEDIFESVLAASRQLEVALAPRIDKLTAELEGFAGFQWQDSQIDIYPTFMFPSFSQPLNLRVVDLTREHLRPRHMDTTIRVLLHELGHRLVPFDLFQDISSYETAMDLLALKTLEANDMGFGHLRAELAKPESWPDIFSPNLREYLQRNGLHIL